MGRYLFNHQPAGWMAGFRNGQLFIISFPLLPQELIHPEQGQVELYHDYRPAALSDGVLEMELHTAYRELQPGEVMTGQETWTLVAYQGADTHEARLAFLQHQLKELKIAD